MSMSIIIFLIAVVNFVKRDTIKVIHFFLSSLFREMKFKNRETDGEGISIST